MESDIQIPRNPSHSEIDQLNDEAWSLRMTDPARALRLSRAIYAAAHELGYTKGMAYSLQTSGHSNRMLRNFDSAKRDSRKAYQMFTELDLPGRERSLALFNLGLDYHECGEYEQALNCFNQGLAFSKKSGHKHATASLHVNAGNSCSKLGDYPRALTHYRNSLSIYRDFDDARIQALLLNNIGAILYQLGDFREALVHFDESNTLLESVDDLRLKVDVLVNLGTIFAEVGEQETALVQFERGLSIARRIKRLNSQAVCEMSIGNSYAALREFDIARGYLQQAFEHYTRADDKRGSAIALLCLGDVILESTGDTEAQEYFTRALAIFAEISDRYHEAAALRGLGEVACRQRLTDKALNVLHHAMDIARAIHSRQIECEIHETMSKVYKLCGAFEKALEHFERFYHLKNEIVSEEFKRQIKNLEVAYGVHETARKNNAGSQSLSRLEYELRVKTKALTESALHLTHKNSFLKSLHDQIAEITRHSDSETGAKFDDVLLRIRGEIRSDNEWKVFEEQFDHTYTDFMKKLSRDFPELTPVELKVAVLLKLNLETKDIARLLCVSPSSINKYRYRIRKKIMVPANLSLSGFLTQI